MTYKGALYRAIATFIVGASAAPVAAGVVNISTLEAMAVAGIIAVWNLAVRTAQAFLSAHPEQVGGFLKDDDDEHEPEHLARRGSPPLT